MQIKSCAKCGSTDRYKNGACKPCHKSWAAAQAGKPCSICGATDRYAGGPCRPCQLKRAKSRPAEERRQYDRAWYAVNKDKDRARKQRWRERNPGRVRECESNKEARRRSAPGKLSRGIQAKLYGEQEGLCRCCQLPLGDNYHIDHIMPLALGGTNTDDNVQLLRAECNLRKGAMHPDEWRKNLAQK